MLRVCAVRYLNTAPLVWGMLHGPQRGRFDLSFEIPAKCADAVAGNAADIGIIPSIELETQDLTIVPGLGIASTGPVRSILLISKVAAPEIRVLAADASSRTSVALSRIILADRYGAEPRILSHAPELGEMLAVADAALIIGDPALHLNPAELRYHVYDLGKEWKEMTGLPMVFAVWAGRPGCITPEVTEIFRDSYEYGKGNMDEILDREALPRGFDRDLARRYLCEHITYELNAEAYRGMELFRRLGRRFADGR
ncbi:MAG: menaquinone biosynthesis protein [Acidobacteriota bacterium]|nr:menaquinone biosynthesis protein [Acidobacteriota bacterium]